MFIVTTPTTGAINFWYRLVIDILCTSHRGVPEQYHPASASEPIKLPPAAVHDLFGRQEQANEYQLQRNWCRTLAHYIHKELDVLCKLRFGYRHLKNVIPGKGGRLSSRAKLIAILANVSHTC